MIRVEITNYSLELYRFNFIINSTMFLGFTVIVAVPVDVVFSVFGKIKVDNEGNLLYINTTSLEELKLNLNV